jgi:hypothetical protein
VVPLSHHAAAPPRRFHDGSRNRYQISYGWTSPLNAVTRVAIALISAAMATIMATQRSTRVVRRARLLISPPSNPEVSQAFRSCTWSVLLGHHDFARQA